VPRKSKQSPPKAADLRAIRKQIDGFDARIQELIGKRASIVHAVGAAKRANAVDANPIEYYRPEREAEVLRNVLERNKQAGRPLRDDEMVRLFREIMSACLAQQEPLKVGFLGPEGTFTQQAVLKHFGHSAHAMPLPTIAEVFYEVQASRADFGVVPVENSTEGTVNHTLDMFVNSSLKICGEIELRIHQNLLGKMRALDGIKRIVSHQQSLAQCRGWLDEHLPNIERVAVSSNAEAARRARDEDGTAAIAGEVAAEIYGLAILESNVEDRADNTTRFLVIGRKLFGPSGNDKTSLLLSIGATQAPGALHKLLEPFARHAINMSRIESRPSHKKKWDYVFFIDVLGHVEQEPLKSALADMKKQQSLLRVLGSYPAAML
jgi:chorismate mutase / prephenate dehydratase